MNDLLRDFSDSDLCRALLDRIAKLEEELADARLLVAKAEALAHEDPLTGRLNRRGFAKELERALAFRQRYGTPAAIILIDVDGLKSVNDRLGHPAGDALIRGLAEVLKRNTRASDVIARLGGDEFCVLVWHADEAIAAAKARSLQATLDKSLVAWNDRALSLASSVGSAELAASMTIDDAMTLADSRLYADKSARRLAKAA